ncbi:MAG TPA: hypothetical protein VM513_31855 [Kofleriaceae bacterium]|jgi:hypothetical protein|nr:hypothetical protein [Kofleriaceae bacterium]
MRALVIIAIAGCGSAARSTPAPAPPVPVAPVLAKTCADAAIGIERVTKDLRAPEHDVLGPMRRRCIDDAWTPAAIECFATMRGDELAACARHLPEPQRSPLVADVIGRPSGDGDVADLVAKLSALQVGIGSCDQFVQAVTNLMGCPAMPIAQRVSLGAETADFWSLPTARLTIDARARISQACGESLHALQQQAADVGCMP